MSSARLSRTARFRAAHHYYRSDWSEARNRRTFGESAVPHEHEYGLEVTVAGEPDPETGFLVDLAKLDEALEELLAPLRDSNLNESIPEARAGAMTTSTENLARWFFEQLEPRVPSPARLVRVRVSESDTLAAEFSPG
jgi:6-pyruvoyltetrahydropterin/6-carboxytetrahydropterin synthase